MLIKKQRTNGARALSVSGTLGMCENLRLCLPVISSRYLMLRCLIFFSSVVVWHKSMMTTSNRTPKAINCF